MNIHEVKEMVKIKEIYMCLFQRSSHKVYETWHEISNNVVCATSKGSD